MAFTYLSSAVSPIGDGGGTAVTGTLDSTNADLLVALVTGRGAPSVSDNKSNTSPGWLGTTLRAGADAQIRLFYCANPANKGTGHTFTGTNTERAAIAAAAFSCGGATVVFDKETGQLDQGSSWSAGPLTPTNNDSLIIQGAGGYASANGMSIGNSGGTYTEIQDRFSFGGLNFECFLAYLIQTTTLATNPTFSVDSPDTGGNLQSTSVVFTVSGGSGGLSIPVAMNAYRQMRSYKKQNGLWTKDHRIKTYCFMPNLKRVA
jgi:hypothetical protein